MAKEISIVFPECGVPGLCGVASPDLVSPDLCFDANTTADVAA